VSDWAAIGGLHSSVTRTMLRNRIAVVITRSG
jgi:hypothetical protein